jgi:hypothetical protein
MNKEILLEDKTAIVQGGRVGGEENQEEAKYIYEVY